MTVIVKVLRDAHTGEGANSAPYTLHVLPNKLTTIEFDRDTFGKPRLDIITHNDKSERVSYKPEGNVYVMDNGQTVSSFLYTKTLSKTDRKAAIDFINANQYGASVYNFGLIDAILVHIIAECLAVRDKKLESIVSKYKPDEEGLAITGVRRLIRELFPSGCGVRVLFETLGDDGQITATPE